MSEELKPCPFCGGEAHIGTVRYSRPLDDVSWADDDAPIIGAFYGHCAKCAAGHRNTVAGGYRTETMAIAAWNTRSTEATLRAENELMMEALADLVSWFPETKPVSEWKIRAGEFGADDAVEAARNALAQVAK